MSKLIQTSMQLCKTWTMLTTLCYWILTVPLL